VRDQVVFEVSIIVVIAESVAEHGVTFEAQQRRRPIGRMVGEGAGGQPQPAEQVVVAGRADDDIDPAGGPLVGRYGDAVRMIDDALLGPEKLMQRRDAR
jgi:hypothetical protein